MATRTKKKEYPLCSVAESLEEERSYLEKPMFGCFAVYLHRRLSLLLSSGEEPWNGLLIPTDHKFHETVRQDFNDVVQHPVLKKWLNLPEASENFEIVVHDIVYAIRMTDLRFGVEPRESVKGKRRSKSQIDF